MNDLLAGPVSVTEREAYACLFYRGPLTHEEVAVYSGINLDEELETLTTKGIIYVVGNEYDVSDYNLSPKQLEVTL